MRINQRKQLLRRRTHLEFPPLCVVPFDGDVGFHLAEAVKIELPDERAKLVV